MESVCRHPSICTTHCYQLSLYGPCVVFEVEFTLDVADVSNGLGITTAKCKVLLNSCGLA